MMSWEKHICQGMKSIAKTAQKYHGDLQTYYDAGHKEFHTIVTLKQL